MGEQGRRHSAPAVTLQQHDELIGRIYDAVGAEHGAGWHDVLDRLGRYTRSRTAVLEFGVARKPAESRFMAAGAQTDGGAIHEWENRDTDEVISYALAPGQIMIRNNYKSLGLPNRFQNLLERYSVSRSITCALEAEQGQQVLFHAARSSTQPPYTRDDQARIRTVARHLSRALRLHIGMVGATQFSGLATDLIADFGVGLVLVGGATGFRPLNAHAERILDSGVIRFTGQTVAADDWNGAQKLQALLHQALQMPVADPACHVGAARLVSASGAPACHVGVKSLTVETAPFRLQRRYAMLYCDDGRSADRDLRPALRALYDFTPAEARIAQQVLRGVELSALPDRLGIRHTTLRFHLESIYDKLNVRTKGGMIAALARGLPFLGDLPADLPARGPVTDTIR